MQRAGLEFKRNRQSAEMPSPPSVRLLKRLVPRVGFEPTRDYSQRILSLKSAVIT